jgi:hypothetical protein
MKLCCHQPNYFPNQNYFDKIAAADTFVILDDVQFEKNGFTNRNRIKYMDGDLWLTIPVIQKSDQLIKDVKTQNSIWVAKHFKTLENKYGRSHFIEGMFGYESDKLMDWTMRSLIFSCLKLNITFAPIMSSTVNAEGKSTEKLVNICKQLKADTYLSGVGAKSYMDMQLFEKEGINVEFMPAKPAPYSILTTLLKWR